MTEEIKPDYIDVSNQGLFFVPLGGVGEIGMNFYLYACDGKWIAVDCGIGFAGGCNSDYKRSCPGQTH